MRWIQLAAWLALCYTVAALGAAANIAEIPTWYRTLARPSFAPPNWLFGPVWTTLYLLMAVAIWLVTARHSLSVRSAVILFLVQLILNLAWSWIFFKAHAIGFALAEIFLLLAAIAATTMQFTRISPIAAWLMVPYLAWVAFATALNFAFWRLNH